MRFGYGGVGLIFRVSKFVEFRKCFFVICIWFRDRWWSLEEGKCIYSFRVGGREV